MIPWEERKKSWTPERRHAYATEIHQEYYVIHQKQYLPVIALLEDWFQAIEAGVASARFPDPFGQRYSEEEVNRYIQLVDNRFEYELVESSGYWHGQGYNSTGVPIDYPPEFDRLEGASREAFVQAVKAEVSKVTLISTEAPEDIWYPGGEGSWFE